MSRCIRMEHTGKVQLFPSAFTLRFPDTAMPHLAVHLSRAQAPPGGLLHPVGYTGARSSAFTGPCRPCQTGGNR